MAGRGSSFPEQLHHLFSFVLNEQHPAHELLEGAQAKIFIRSSDTSLRLRL
jgi:hypothetical protein